MSRAAVLILLSALYLAQGLPYGFFTQALPVLMREQGLSLTRISLTSFLFIPWALKFLWAPYVDRVGSRRQWLLVMQLATVIGAGALATLDLSQSLWPVFAALVLFNVLAATQDVATDGLAVTLLGTRDRGLANGLQVGGYRVGMIIGGGALLWVFSWAGWRPMFAAMAALLLLSTLPVWTLREPPRTLSAPRARPSPLAWRERLLQPGMPAFVLLICSYRFGDSMGAALIGPFMHDQGLSLAQIALIKGTLGSGSALAGALIGAALAYRLRRRSVLLFGGVTQSLSLVLYALAASGLGSDVISGYPLLASACIAEHVFGGIATVALYSLMMDACEPEHAGADYTLLASAVVIAQGLASLAAGVLADAAGYTTMLSLSVLLSAGGCVLLIRRLDRGGGPALLRRQWAAAQ